MTTQELKEQLKLYGCFGTWSAKGFIPLTASFYTYTQRGKKNDKTRKDRRTDNGN